METASILRYTIGGLDNMPDIAIYQDDRAFARKLDQLLNEVIKPSFEQILVKHKLTTQIDLNISFTQLPKSDIYSATAAGAYWVFDSPEPFKFQLNPDSTNICGSLLSKIVAEEKMPPRHFSAGNYTLNKDARPLDNHG